MRIKFFGIDLSCLGLQVVLTDLAKSILLSSFVALGSCAAAESQPHQDVAGPSIPPVSREHQPGWQAQDFGDLSYRILLPVDFSPTQRYPLLLFLHGSGEDVDASQPEPAVAGKYFGTREFRARHSAIVIAPQCPGSIDFRHCNWGGFNSEMDPQEQKVVDLVNRFAHEQFVDASRIYITGLSLGGIAAWDLIGRYPRLFAAAIPVAGGAFSASPDYDELLIQKPIWAAHGAQDSTVAPDLDRQHFAAIKKIGGKKIFYTEYPNLDHDVWDTVYADSAYTDWLFEQSVPKN